MRSSNLGMTLYNSFGYLIFCIKMKHDYNDEEDNEDYNDDFFNTMYL